MQMHKTDEKYLITVLGHTAGGKTRFAAQLAARLDAEIISGDSRQVYRRMDLGTGKDLNDYLVEGRRVPCHLIDIRDPGQEYNVYEYQKDFLDAYRDIIDRGKDPLLCGGSGLYLEAVLKGYRLIRVPVNPALRASMADQTTEELTARLASFRKLHNTTDTTQRKRLIRALEIETYYRDHPHLDTDYPAFHPLVIGIRYQREERRRRISKRLQERLDAGMVEEVRELIGEGLSPEQLIYYGLEYKYITEYLSGKRSYGEMTTALETAIHQFAKRQMTWFRGMERRGLKIHWLEGESPEHVKLRKAMKLISHPRKSGITRDLRNPTSPGSS